MVRAPATNNDVIVDRRVAAKKVEGFTPYCVLASGQNDRRSIPNATYAV